MGTFFPCILDKAEPRRNLKSALLFCTGKLSISVATRAHHAHVIHSLLVLAHKGSERDDALLLEIDGGKHSVQ
jgi:hypothetical protein